MTTLRDAAQQALEALTNCTSEYGHRCNRCDSEVDEGGKVVEALRAALAEPEQEPYCYVYEYDSPYGLHREFYPREYNGMKPTRTVPLYAAPPQRKPAYQPVVKVPPRKFPEDNDE